MKTEKVFELLKDQVQTFSEDNPHIRSFVIGLSGGIDSAIVAALVNAAICDRGLKCKLLGYSIPANSNTKDESNRALDVGKAFCDEFHNEVDFMDSIFTEYEKWVCAKYFESEVRLEDQSIDEKIRLGNIKARLRMIHLFDMAKYNEGVVLSTDNLTEYLLGFWTLHGDVGNFGLIQNLWKSEVYKLSAFLINRFNEVGFHGGAQALSKCAKAVPTDGLGISGSDFDQLGAGSYGEIDQILMTWIFRLEGWAQYKDHPVIQRHKATRFKRNDPLNVDREKLGLGNWL